MRLATRHSRIRRKLEGNETHDVVLEKAWSIDSVAERSRIKSNRGRKLEGNMAPEKNFNQRMSNTQIAQPAASEIPHLVLPSTDIASL